MIELRCKILLNMWQWLITPRTIQDYLNSNSLNWYLGDNKIGHPDGGGMANSYNCWIRGRDKKWIFSGCYLWALKVSRQRSIKLSPISTRECKLLTKDLLETCACARGETESCEGRFAQFFLYKFTHPSIIWGTICDMPSVWQLHEIMAPWDTVTPWVSGTTHRGSSHF